MILKFYLIFSICGHVAMWTASTISSHGWRREATLPGKQYENRVDKNRLIAILQVSHRSQMEGLSRAEEIEKLEDMEQPEGKHGRSEQPIPQWTEQLTVRGLVASFLIGTMYSIIIMKLNLTTGLSPTLNVSAALLSFFFLKAWTKILSQLGWKTMPFTKQENTVVQTCAVACYSISVAGKVIMFYLCEHKCSC
jgi:OPT oligopeptide transporter protein